MEKFGMLILTIIGSFLVGISVVFALSLIGDVATGFYDSDSIVYGALSVLVGYITIYIWKWFDRNYEEKKPKPNPIKWYNLFVVEEEEKK